MSDVEVGVFESSQSGYAHSSEIVTINLGPLLRHTRLKVEVVITRGHMPHYFG
jgi:hypothetical protein